MLCSRIHPTPWILAFAAVFGLVVWTASAHFDRAIAGEDRVRAHRYHRMNEEEKEQFHETLADAMETVQQALARVFDGLEISVDLGDLDLDFSGLENGHVVLDDTDIVFEFDSEEFAAHMEEFGERMEVFGDQVAERMKVLGESLEGDGNWNWDRSSHSRHGSRGPSGDYNAAGLRDEIRDLREQIRSLERQLDDQRENEGM